MGGYEEEETPVPEITENASEQRDDCLQSVYNSISCEPCPPHTLGSHAPFHMTLHESLTLFCLYSITLLSSKVIFRICLGNFLLLI